MPTPNQMPRNNDKLREQIVHGLIATAPSSWDFKSLEKDKEGKETVVTKRVNHNALRYQLSANVSDSNVERMARRWLR